MKARASAPVTAPGARQWQDWWSVVVTRVVEPDGTDGSERRWRPGARVDLTPAGLTRGAVDATVRTVKRRRAVTVVYREHADAAREGQVDVDGMEELHTVTTRGSLEPVRWTGEASFAVAGPVLRLDVTLPWGRLQVRARIVTDRQATDRLDTEIVVRGRGSWRPLAAVGLRLGREQLQAELARATTAAAAALTRVARDPGAGTRPGDELDDLIDGLSAGSAGTTAQTALDLSWLRSPVTMLRHARRPPKTGPDQQK